MNGYALQTKHTPALNPPRPAELEKTAEQGKTGQEESGQGQPRAALHAPAHAGPREPDPKRLSAADNAFKNP